jgi:hypothetical protein
MLSTMGEMSEPLFPGMPSEARPVPLRWWQAALVLLPFAAFIAFDLLFGK